MKKIILFIAVLAILSVCGIVYLQVEAKTTNEKTKTNQAQTALQEQIVSKNRGKVLIAYFTMPETDGVDANSGASRVKIGADILGSTQYVANVISEATGGDSFVIKTVKKYPVPHDPLVKEAKEEHNLGVRPKISSHIENIDKYDVIFIGYPIWWYDMPMVLYGFFDEYDFSGKTIIPFCTHGGSRLLETEKTIATLEKNAVLVKGLAVSVRNPENAKESVISWLKDIKMVE